MMDRSFHKVHVYECPEEVVVVVPRAAEDVRLVDHVSLDEVLEEEWTWHGGKHSAERDGGAT
jgi:hypothetical protein